MRNEEIFKNMSMDLIHMIGEFNMVSKDEVKKNRIRLMTQIEDYGNMIEENKGLSEPYNLKWRCMLSLPIDMRNEE